MLGFLPAYMQEEGFASSSGSGFKLLWLAEQVAGPLPRGGTLYIGLAALVLIGLALAVGFRSDRSEEASMRSLVWLLTAFLVLSSPHYPWYFAWLIVFACLVPSASLLWLTLASFLLYLVPVGSQLVRDRHRFLVETAIYVPFLALAALDLWHRRPRRRGGEQPGSS